VGERALSLLALFLALLLVLAVPLGRWLAALIAGRLPPWMRRVEAVFYRLAGVRPGQAMTWRGYALGLLAFNGLGVGLLYGLQRAQGALPLNPAGLPGVAPDLAFNTAISFVTNTNWQAYAGEATMSHLTQMLGLAAQNFLSAASGIAVAFALIRGFAARGAANDAASHAGNRRAGRFGAVGNVWADLTRITLWLLLPLSLVLALFFVSQGVIQNFDGPREITPLRGGTQTLALGPVASQEAIKLLGTNGGGFFGANSAHPFENPTALTHLAQMLAILLIPAALCLAFGRAVGDGRQGWALLAAMTLIFVAAVVAETAAEQAGNPRLTALGVDGAAGNLEGKELRLGLAGSSLFTVVTTAASCGAVVAAHDALTPLGGLVPLVLMQLGEVVFGGAGSGLYGMLVFALLAVFIAGLMIGRTPEYLGKKVEVLEMKLVALVILVTPLLVLLGSAAAVSTAAGRAGITHPGAHGFTQVLYAFSSAANNNGSAFGGLAADSPFYDALLGVAMWLGRFAVIVPVLALAGALAGKPRLPVTAGTLPTHGPLFVALLIGTVLFVGLLNYVPALALGPVVEHLLLWPGSPR
jgi:K+-transporting ATPase ATPase A chain